MGDSARARQALEQIEKANRAGSIGVDPIPPLINAYAGLGDKEKLLATMQKAYRQRTSLPITFKVGPIYDSVRSDPRFQEMLRGAGFDH